MKKGSIFVLLLEEIELDLYDIKTNLSKIANPCLTQYTLLDYSLYSKGWYLVNRFNYTSLVVVVTPTDRRKSVRNHCVTEVSGGVVCYHVGITLSGVSLSVRLSVR